MRKFSLDEIFFTAPNFFFEISEVNSPPSPPPPEIFDLKKKEFFSLANEELDWTVFYCQNELLKRFVMTSNGETEKCQVLRNIIFCFQEIEKIKSWKERAHFGTYSRVVLHGQFKKARNARE